MKKIYYCNNCGGILCTKKDRFCPVCGAVVKKERSKTAKFFLALLECLCFYLIYMGVTFAAEFIYGMSVSARMMFSGSFDVKTYYALFSEYFCEVASLASAVCLLAFFLVFKIRKKRFSQEISLHKVAFAPFAGFFGMGFTGQVAIVSILSIVYTLYPSLYEYSASDSINDLIANANPVSIVLYIGIITPILEEVLFRGIIYTRLRNVLPTKAAIVLSAVVFGAAHGNAEQFLYATFMAIFFAAAFRKYNSVWASTSIHMAFNLTSFFMVYMPQAPAAFVCIMLICAGLFMLLAAYLLMIKTIPIKAVKYND